jgi:hypothetical protein
MRQEKNEVYKNNLLSTKSSIYSVLSDVRRNRLRLTIMKEEIDEGFKALNIAIATL